MLGVPAAPAEQIDRPVGGARSPPLAGMPIWPGGASGTPKIGEIKVDVTLSSKLN